MRDMLRRIVRAVIYGIETMITVLAVAAVGGFIVSSIVQVLYSISGNPYIVALAMVFIVGSLGVAVWHFINDRKDGDS